MKARPINSISIFLRQLTKPFGNLPNADPCEDFAGSTKDAGLFFRQVQGVGRHAFFLARYSRALCAGVFAVPDFTRVGLRGSPFRLRSMCSRWRSAPVLRFDGVICAISVCSRLIFVQLVAMLLKRVAARDV